MLDWREFRLGFLAILPMLVAYVPIGLLWGGLAASKGLHPAEALLMSLGVYSGAAQFVAMDLWTQSLPLLFFAFTVATVSLRHVLMSASISRHITHFPRPTASLLLFWLTDEAWALLEKEARARQLTPSYFFGLAMPLWPTWSMSALAGAYAGQLLGDISAYGVDFGFVFAAMFIALLTGFWKGTATGIILATSAAVAVAAKLLGFGAWYILAGGLAGMIAAVVLYRDEANDAD